MILAPARALRLPNLFPLPDHSRIVAMFHLVLYQPEIPPNTGNIIRLAANTGARLHLVGPLGFALDDRRLRRAGLDYHEFAPLIHHRDWQTFQSQAQPTRIWAFSSKAGRAYCQARFTAGDALLFGPETRGLPGEVLLQIPREHQLRLPMVPGSRSLNLSNAVAVATYEAWRQCAFAGACQ